MDVLDDHSRVVLAARVCSGPTGEAAWETFCCASSGWGLPAHVMSDNGTCFTSFHRTGAEADFERDLRALGIRHIRSRPGHPQTCGKLERFHQTLKRWLRLQPLAGDPAELQAQLDTFLAFYNHQRPHRALAGDTPADRWAASPPATPGDPIPEAPRASLQTVYHGTFRWGGRYQIGVGNEHTGQKVLVIARGENLAVFGSTGHPQLPTHRLVPRPQAQEQNRTLQLVSAMSRHTCQRCRAT